MRHFSPSASDFARRPWSISLIAIFLLEPLDYTWAEGYPGACKAGGTYDKLALESNGPSGRNVSADCLQQLLGFANQLKYATLSC